MGAVILNIGLAGPTAVSWQLNMGIAARILLRASPYVPVGMFLEPKSESGPAEPTLVARLENHTGIQVARLCFDICEHTSQDCIAVKAEGTPFGVGALFGPRPEQWLPFNEAFFINWR